MDGEAVTQGFDPLDLPVDRFLNWVWHTITKGMDDKARRSFEIEVYRPLPGMTLDDVTDGPWSDEEATRSFMALAGQIGGVTP